MANKETGPMTGPMTGTMDKDYNIMWFTEACLSNVLRLETYVHDAERAGDKELAGFFRKSQAESRREPSRAGSCLPPASARSHSPNRSRSQRSWIGGWNVSPPSWRLYGQI
jgi:hypothetical protein